MGNDAQTLKSQIPPPRNHNSRRRRSGAAQSHQFPIGSRIEVGTDEKHFKGVYFSATVISPPISPRKKNPTTTTKNSTRLYVEYHDLLAHEDRPDPLREYVKSSTVRPAPPSHEVAQGFGPNDVVDAFYLDGWWTGVVSRVAEDGESLVVAFENPTDELEFGLSRLRAHWDWIDGVWVGPQKRCQAAFEVGMKVEVWFESEDEFHGAWYPATIAEDLGNGSFLVEFKDSDGVCMKSEVDSVRVRPCPPIIKDWEFGASEKVDAFHNFGWWSGLISKRLERNEYIVFFEEIESDIVFDFSDLRPHMDWKDEKWLIGLDNHKTTPSSTKRKRSKRNKIRVCLSDSDSDSGAANPEIKKISAQVEDVEATEQQSWPFAKRNTVWKSFESMDAFKNPPQKPHFKPLLEFNESRREGMAIGCMATFSNVAETISRLKTSDPKCVVDDVNETLADLEAHGFDVGPMRERVVELTKAKDEEEKKLVDKVKDLNVQISERECRKRRIEAEIGAMNEHMRRLQEQMVASEIEKAVEVDEIALLQCELKETEASIEVLRCSFEVGAVAASFL